MTAQRQIEANKRNGLAAEGPAPTPAAKPLRVTRCDTAYLLHYETLSHKGLRFEIEMLERLQAQRQGNPRQDASENPSGRETPALTKEIRIGFVVSSYSATNDVPLTTLRETAPHPMSDGGHKRSAAVAVLTPSRVAHWIGFVFGAELLLAAAVLGANGITEAGIDLALMLTARLAFPLFWLAYAGSALATLFGSRFEPLRRQARALGLAFAAAMAVHLALVAMLCVIGATPAARVFVIFGTAAVCIYTLALFSIARLRQAIGPRSWAVLSFAAMNYVALAFLDDFRTDLFAAGVKHALLYWPFLALALAGPALRFAAFLHAQRPRHR